MTTNAPARAEIDFDPATLRAFLASALPDGGGEPAIERIGGGQSNPTYFVDLGDRRMVLRKRPHGEHPRGAHDVGREYRIIEGAAPHAGACARADPLSRGAPMWSARPST